MPAKEFRLGTHSTHTHTTPHETPLTTLHHTTVHRTAPHCTATQHNTTRHDTTRHDTTQHNTTQHTTHTHTTRTTHNTTHRLAAKKIEPSWASTNRFRIRRSGCIHMDSKPMVKNQNSGYPRRFLVGTSLAFIYPFGLHSGFVILFTSGDVRYVGFSWRN